MEPQKIFTAILLGSFGLCFLWRLLQLIYTAAGKPLALLLRRHLAYTGIFPDSPLDTLNPTRLEMLLYTAHLATTMTFNIYGIGTLQAAGIRAAQLAIVHLLPLFAFRQLSFAADTFALSLRSFHKIHRSMGVMATIQSAIHVAITLQGTRPNTVDAISGVVCLTALALLVLLPAFRRYAYEMFLRSHLALAVVAAVALWEHLHVTSSFSRLLLIITSGVFAVSSLIQILRQIYGNLSWTRHGICMGSATLSRQTDSVLILKLSLSRRWKIEPGQHIYLTLLTLSYGSIFQRHPFMIVWWQQDVENELPGSKKARSKKAKSKEAMSIFVAIRRERGWTRHIPAILPEEPVKLVEDSKDNKSTAKDMKYYTWLQGPYGVPYNLAEYGIVLLFASGDGIYAQLPFIKGLTDLWKISALKTTRIKLVWQVDAFDNHPLKPWLDAIFEETFTNKELLDISIHEEIPGKLHREDWGDRLRSINRRPDISSYVGIYMGDRLKSIAVTVSGCSELREEVRNQVRAKDRPNVYLVELDFQPTTPYSLNAGECAERVHKKSA